MAEAEEGVHFLAPMHIKVGTADLHLTFDETNKRLKEAQFWLDSIIMLSMMKFMPKITGSFIDQTQARSAAIAGKGVVCAASGPMGRYLYYGKKMVNAATGKGPLVLPGKDDDGNIMPGVIHFRWPKGAKLRPTTEPLNYTKTANPNVTARWFDTADNMFHKQWVAGVQRVLNGEDGGTI